MRTLSLDGVGVGCAVFQHQLPPRCASCPFRRWVMLSQAELSRKPDESLTAADPERTVEFEFVRATENAALNVLHWLGRGNKEKADAAACDAINGVFDLVDICGEVVIGEGIKDQAPGLFLGDKLGTWKPGSPRFDIAVDPIDGTTNLANGLPNSISVMAASQRRAGGPPAMHHVPSFYSMKLAYGPEVVKALAAGLRPIQLDDPLKMVLRTVAEALGKLV